MKYKFKFSLFKRKVQMFSEGERGIVVEKEMQSVCVYGTDSNYNILCAIPLCHPKFLKGAEYIVEFDENNCAKVYVGDLQIVINYSKKKCANNKSLKCCGSNNWGQDVQSDWNDL